MKGTILDFSIQTNSGTISGDDDNRYFFTGAEWKENRPPQRGDKVDFAVDIDNNATGIYLVNYTVKKQPKSLNHSLAEEKDYNIFDWCIKCMQNYVNFNGRARRKEYWFFQLGLVCIGFALMLSLALFGVDAGDAEAILGLCTLGFMLPTYAVGARRLHDIGKSGWWQLLYLIPLVGYIILIIWFAKEGDDDENEYGMPTK